MKPEYIQGYKDGFSAGQLKAHDVAFDLENRWRVTADKYRAIAKGSWFKQKWEVAAKTVDAAVSGLAAVRMVIMKQKPKDLEYDIRRDP